MYGLPLQDVAVWYVDANVEQRLCNGYALDKEQESVCCSLEAIERNKAYAI